jgi:hypothetical protein
MSQISQTRRSYTQHSLSDSLAKENDATRPLIKGKRSAVFLVQCPSRCPVVICIVKMSFLFPPLQNASLRRCHSIATHSIRRHSSDLANSKIKKRGATLDHKGMVMTDNEMAVERSGFNNTGNCSDVDFFIRGRI